MKLTNTFIAIGLVLGGISTVDAGGISTCDENHWGSQGIPAPCPTSIDLHDVNFAHDQEGKGLIASDGDRIIVTNVRQKTPSARVDLLIKRSRDGIHVTISHQTDKVANRDHQNGKQSRSGEFPSPSRVCSFARESVEQTSLEWSDPSVAGEFGRTNRSDLFNVRLTHFPGPMSLGLSILDLIGVVIGCYCRRRSNVV